MKPQKRGPHHQYRQRLGARGRDPTRSLTSRPKCALEGMTHSIALDHRADGITCSILHPGVNRESHLGGAASAKPAPPSQMMVRADEGSSR